jgi:DNA gyrase/topoisomerase IV subunit B
MTNQQKIQAEFEAIMNQGKSEAKAVVEKAAKEAKNATKIERKRPTLVKYTIEDVTPAGYGI